MYVPIFKAPQRGKGQYQFDYGHSADDFPNMGSPGDGVYFAHDRSLAETYAESYGEGVIEVRIPAMDYIVNFERYKQKYEGGPMFEYQIPNTAVSALNAFTRIWHR